MSEIPMRKRAPGLGRGLSALLGESAPSEERPGAGKGVQLVPVASIAPNPDQPRRHFDEAALNELAESIRARGVLQPLVVRPHGGRYQIVAGERRWRAAQRAQLHEVPVVVREFDDPNTLEVALIENIQRQDLNAVEEAEAYQRLIADFGHTQDALGKIVHKSRSHVANLLRLLDLPASVRAKVASGEISMGHARALVSAPDAEQLADDIVARGLSVRDVEKLVRDAKPRKAAGDRVPSGGGAKDADLAALERQLGDMLGLKVAIGYQDGAGGTVTLTYSTLDQLDMICQRLSNERI
ncbi:ParB/RepB/Spo0J family partition protein [Allosphingosinicella flava]|uniref:ParB/RepB/Spo0J family partition protein n=1 Tax=Allosphingosinicella flava TaxID=2771430 RepID=A0A7T2GIM2_9SPHN|nr:ParB/RepB/Spo0J family partition protein [Sphingosinicella flava]QPQ54531.1 ParB/RepB/Spo0J family partition protein [Sphingosinicella flava]